MFKIIDGVVDISVGHFGTYRNGIVYNTTVGNNENVDKSNKEGVEGGGWLYFSFFIIFFVFFLCCYLKNKMEQKNVD